MRDCDGGEVRKKGTKMLLTPGYNDTNGSVSPTRNAKSGEVANVLIGMSGE